MNKYFILFLLIVTLLSYADHDHTGYVVTTYGEPVKTGYGDCLHSVYFNNHNHVEPKCENDVNKSDNKNNNN